MQQAGTVLKDLRTEGSSELILTSPMHLKYSEKLLEALTWLAETRQTSLSKQTLRTYLGPLAKHDLRDVQTAVARLAVASEAIYQTAFPRLCLVVEFVEVAYRERTRPAPWVSCGQCNESGMVRVYRDANGQRCSEGEHASMAMGECRCKREWRAKRDALKGVQSDAA